MTGGNGYVLVAIIIYVLLWVYVLFNRTRNVHSLKEYLFGKGESMRTYENCKFQDGCSGAMFGEVCSEHKFEDEGGGEELTESEKKSILGDLQYQRLKENDF